MTASEVRFWQSATDRSDTFLRVSTYLGSDELETGELSPRLILDDLGDLGVGLGEGLVEAVVLAISTRSGWTVGIETKKSVDGDGAES